MNILAVRWKPGSAFAYISLALSLMSPVTAGATETVPLPNPGPAFEFKQYHVHYDVKADGTYEERGDFAALVLNDTGAHVAGQMPIGMDNVYASPNYLYVKINDAYLLKKDGTHVPAAPQSSVGAVHGMATVAFPQAEIGDTLVVSYTTTLDKPPAPNSLAISMMFTPFFAYDDAEISLDAPASMKLHVYATPAGEGRHTNDGASQKWKWKFQSKPTESPGPAPLYSLNVSTFEDMDAERQAVMAYMNAMPPQASPGDGAQCESGTAGLDDYVPLVQSAFWTDGTRLERMAHEWSDPSCVFRDGRPMMMALTYGYDGVMRDEADWSKTRARIDELNRQFPGKAFVALADGAYWIDYAWNARGNGYSSSVSADGMKLFRQRLENAETSLLDAKPYATQLPAWYVEMINVQSALGRPEDERDKVFVEGVRHFPAYFPIYFKMARYLEPKWGGTWRTVDNMARWSVKQTRKVNGDSLYARIYWVVSQSYPQDNIFKTTFASWPEMKHGFEDMLARNPYSSWNLNNFARFACMAGDRQTFLELRKKMGETVDNDAWTGNINLDLCETKFGYAE